ncbi:flagellar basal-body MS-ring/collar protein FliF [Laribacter hongkongensis]|uniref:flagellar basal-body MS-ring/collar protein FliF n=1 Tax=Laribacter hongkongensis TaxID=168471 RepID=UPI001EFE49C4|nr:flagellar basal-body MS-ring/collar protein FliF [Laribacter hongkongensis]MCG9080274.1 flagellar M-ring protein FliF [Laribacter hongkongensis]MCG9082621.1 flagellar M-ring protein FliF [Laribacter hongkongensis]MCG9097869.1 flagellar M-ring protein FliF [Laribacter hongkongensis]
MAELNESSPPTFQQRVREALERYRALPGNKKLLLFGGMAAVASILVAAYLYTREPAYKVLFSNLPDREGGQVTEALTKLNVPYQLADGGVIRVPAEQVYSTRLKLASEGLPKASGIGFELMDNQKFGISQFAEQVNYQRAVEGELARTIEALGVVESARVHLAMPKQSVFVREQQLPTASVLLNLRPGFILDAGQIAGIRNLVASAVPGLPQKNITIVDQEGNLISRMPDMEDGSAGLSRRQLDYVRQIETSLTKRIEAILEPIVGSGNARAQVTAAVDFSEVEQTAETFNPNTPPNAGAIRSQQTSESQTREEAPQGGVPGALSNQPPNAAAAPVTLPPGTQAGLMPAPNGQQNQARPVKSSKEATTNYEVDRTIQHVRQQTGALKRVTAAVVVNFKRTTTADGNAKMTPLSEQEMQQLDKLVREAMGFTQARGDSVQVVNASFADTAGSKAALQDRLLDYASNNPGEILKWVLGALVVLYLLFGVIRPVVRDIVKPKPVLPPPGSDAAAAEGEGVAGEGGMTLEDLANLDPKELARREYDSMLEGARQVVRADPRMAAQIIKEWVNNDE